MIKLIHRLSSIVAVTIALGAGMQRAHAQSVPISERIDSLSSSVDRLESKVLSTYVFGGSSPISFSGEARFNTRFHNATVYPDYMSQDNTYLQSGWGGNENLFRLGMTVRPGRNTVLYSRIGFQHTFTGITGSDSHRIGTGLHDKDGHAAAIHEDMNAGLAVRTIPASFWVRMGNTIWTEASPLTIWKAQPRNFAWEFLPFEVEQPVARFYEYNIARGVRTGRAAWNKKPFNGFNLESIMLPGDIYFNFVYGTFERFDNFEREYIEMADRSYAGDDTPYKSHGVGDSYRKALHTRIASRNLLGDLNIGANYLGILYNEDVIYTTNDERGNVFKNHFRIGTINPGADIGTRLAHKYIYDEDGNLLSAGRGFYKEPKVFSLDLKGNITDNISLHTDFALGKIDTTWKISNAEGIIDSSKQTSSDLTPAFYAQFDVDGRLPFQLDLAYISPGFYSPFSFATPVDGFYAFGSNMVGPGKFIGRGEGSPYTQNMAGAQVTLNPDFGGYGHFRVKYGQHFQIDPSKDVLYFPYRLNSPDLYPVFQSSYNRWGNNLLDHSLDNKYNKRLGDESFAFRTEYLNPVGHHGGGLRADFMSVYNGFAAYDNAKQVELNSRFGGDRSIVTQENDTLMAYSTVFNESAIYLGEDDTIYTNTSFVPENRKFTFNLEADIAYCISRLVGYNNDLFVGGYAAINGVSRSFSLLEFNDKSEESLLWSFYLRLEPAIAITNNFYILGLFGLENWRSQKAWMHLNNEFVNVPINFVDRAYGIGFDLGMLERVWLNGRFKYMTHEDKEFSDNNWKMPVVTLELKTWF
ncbi:hypothetical protein QA601_03265 [Chitinispirillales bacterium ANBcel5]|uniref:hypothetical protein n=1 Tax=Cellulosispirillum alkaliphilum TaxID=3039283 RepID=UPI002A58FEEC|nr:hypothetical protein [Chitinispirillales bacterium ANBcel5]